MNGLFSTCESTPAAIETQMSWGIQSVRARRDSGHPLAQLPLPLHEWKSWGPERKTDFITHGSDKITQVGNGRMRTTAGHVRMVWGLLNILHMPDTVVGAGNAAVTTTGLKTGKRIRKREQIGGDVKGNSTPLSSSVGQCLYSIPFSLTQELFLFYLGSNDVIS